MTIVKDTEDFLNNKDNFFNANERLKKSGIEIEFTEEQKEELIKCATDPFYFIENYVHIISLDKGLMLMKLYDYQRELIDLYINNRKIIAMQGRQTGKTTTTMAYLLWKILFTDDYSIAIVANKAESAQEILSRLQTAYEYLPYWLQQGVTEWNKRSIVLENRSKIFTGATTASGIRGKSCNCLYIDECAFIPSKIAPDFFTSILPVLSSSNSSQLIMSSTPNGFNHFYEYWKGAEAGVNGFKYYKTEWDCVPGRDEKWKQEQMTLLSKQKFNQEVLCSFLGSSDTLINDTDLEILEKFVSDKHTIYESINDFDIKTRAIYKEVNPNHQYFITVDTSKGGGGDFQVVSVFDITKKPFELIDVFRDNTTIDIDMAEIIYDIAKKYNNAYVLIEINKSDKIAYSLWNDFNYEYILSVSKNSDGRKVLRGFDTSEMGITTDKKIKKDGCGALRKLVESQDIEIYDHQAVKELKTFIFKDNSYSADEGYTDDVAMCLVLFSWVTTQEFFKEISLLTKEDLERIRLKNEQENKMKSIVFVNNTPEGLRKVSSDDIEQRTATEIFFFGYGTKK